MAFLDKVLQYGIIAVAFSLPFVRLTHLTEYLFLSLLIIWLGKSLFTYSLPFERTSLDVPILVFLGWALFTVPFATDWLYSLEEWRKSLPRFLIFWYVVNVVKTEQDIRLILHSFSIGLVLLAILESVYFFVEGGDAFSMKMRAGGFSGSSQWLSCFLVIGIPIFWLGFFSGTRPWVRRLYLSALGISGVALFLVHTRAAWLAVMTQGFFYVMLRMTRSWMISGLVVFFSVGLMIVFLAIPGQHHELFSSSKFTSSRSMVYRFNTWDLATTDIREHPLTGIGYGKHSFSLKHPNLEKSYHAHIHNSFLSSAVQVGIPGFLVLAWIFWVALRKSSEWSQKFSEQFSGKLGFAVFFITVGLTVRLIFDDMLIGNVVYLFMLLLGVCFSLGGHLEAREKMKTVAEGS